MGGEGLKNKKGTVVPKLVEIWPSVSTVLSKVVAVAQTGITGPNSVEAAERGFLYVGLLANFVG